MAEYTYWLQLELLAPEGARFSHQESDSTVVSSPHIELPASDWDKMGRPGYIEVQVKAKEAP